jgi:hypothetical protein
VFLSAQLLRSDSIRQIVERAEHKKMRRPEAPHHLFWIARRLDQ